MILLDFTKGVLVCCYQSEELMCFLRPNVILLLSLTGNICMCALHLTLSFRYTHPVYLISVSFECKCTSVCTLSYNYLSLSNLLSPCLILGLHFFSCLVQSRRHIKCVFFFFSSEKRHIKC